MHLLSFLFRTLLVLLCVTIQLVIYKYNRPKLRSSPNSGLVLDLGQLTVLDLHALNRD